MSVFVEPSRELPLVSATIAFQSGAAHDPPGKEGVMRIVARMLRRGAEGLPALEIEERIDGLGGEFASDTSQSASSASFEVIRRSLEPMAEIVATVVGRPAFDLEELERLKREIEAEIIESRDSDGTLCSRAFRRTIFEGHPYGRRVSGSIASVRGIGRDDVERAYRAHYTRKNAALAVTGDVEPSEAEALAASVVAHLPEGARVADPAPPPATKPGRRLVFVDKPERTQTQMIVGGLGTHPSDPDHTALLVANTAFGGTFTSRLMQEIRAKRGWSYGAYSRVGFDRQRDAFTMWAAPAATDAPACLSLILELFRAFREDGITEEELTFVKNYLVRSHAFEVDTAKKRVHQALEVELYDLPPDYHTRYVERVEAVTLEEARRAVRERLSDRDLVIAVVGTHADLGAAIEKSIPDLAGARVDPFDLE